MLVFGMWIPTGYECLITAESPREGQALDIDPEAGKDQVGARRDKGHRYLRFETQVGRSFRRRTKKTSQVYAIMRANGGPVPAYTRVCAPESYAAVGGNTKIVYTQTMTIKWSIHFRSESSLYCPPWTLCSFI